MALIDKLTAIADAIRSKTSSTEKITLEEMAAKIEGMQTGGIVYGANNFEQNITSTGKTIVPNERYVEINFYEVFSTNDAKYDYWMEGDIRPIIIDTSQGGEYEMNVAAGRYTVSSETETTLTVTLNIKVSVYPAGNKVILKTASSSYAAQVFWRTVSF